MDETTPLLRDKSATSNNNAGNGPFQYHVYSRRWMVLGISVTTVFLRAFIDACFGNINDVFARFFNKSSEEIDWFMLVQSASLILGTLPMSVVTRRLNLRANLCLTTAVLSCGYLLTALGMLTRCGFPIIVAGQLFEGFVNIISWSLVPAVAAVWFPPTQVAVAVAVQVMARGAGEAVGCVLPPNIVSVKSTVEQVKWNLFATFLSLTGAAILMLVLSTFFTSGPPTPPSEAEAKASIIRKTEQSADFRETVKNYLTTMRTLLKSRNFLLIWIVCACVGTTLRTNNILLSSMLHRQFPGHGSIDQQVGVFLAISWAAYIFGGFLAGPVIVKTRCYKEISAGSVLLMFLTTFAELAGFYFENIYLIFGSVVTQGFASGLINASVFELIVEVTYPESTVFVSMLLNFMVGVLRLLYPVVGRALLKHANPTWSTFPPVLMTFVSCFLILLVTKDYRREIANNETLLGNSASDHAMSKESHNEIN